MLALLAIWGCYAGLAGLARLTLLTGRNLQFLIRMTERVMMGTRVPLDWQQKIKQLSLSTGRKESELLREAIGKYLGEHDPGAVMGMLDEHEERLRKLEEKLSGLGKVFG